MGETGVGDIQVGEGMGNASASEGIEHLTHLQTTSGSLPQPWGLSWRDRLG